MMEIYITRRRFCAYVILGFLTGAIVYYTTVPEDGVLEISLRILVAFLFFICINQGSKERNWINPYYLFSLVPLSLLLYSEKVSEVYLDRLSSDVWILAVVNIIAFLIGLSLVKQTPGDYLNDPENLLTAEYADNDISEYECITSAVVLLAIGRFPTIVRWLTGYSIPFAGIIAFFTYAAIPCVMKSKNKFWITVISAIIVGFVLVGSINKTTVIFYIMAYLLSYEKYYVKSTKQRVELLVAVIILALLFVVIIFPLKDFVSSGRKILEFRLSDIYSTSDYYSNNIDWSGNQLLMMPYMYLIEAWNNVRYVIETQSSHTYGLWFIKPLLGYFSLDSYFEELYTLVPGSNFNTFTYLAVLYKDFGMFGSALESLFLGWFVKHVYINRYVCSESPYDLICYSFVACATLEMFFSNHFFGQSYPFTVILIMWVYKNTILRIFKREN